MDLTQLPMDGYLDYSQDFTIVNNTKKKKNSVIYTFVWCGYLHRLDPRIITSRSKDMLLLIDITKLSKLET